MARELWQNPYSIHSRPRESLIEILEGCRKRDIKYGLSSWFLSHGTGRSEQFSGAASLVRAWNETLAFIDDHGLLENVLYVDLLNEYPLWNGFVWMKNELARIGGQDAFQCDDEKRNEPPADLALGRWQGYNQEQRDFYNAFINDSIAGVKKEWPDLKVFACETCDYAVPWSDTDRSNFDVMDIHLWFCYHKGFHEYTRYFERLHTRENDHEYTALNAAVKKYWIECRDELISWMDDEIGQRAGVAKKHGVPIGNTEGWGPINWEEHPYLDWDFAKDAARVAVSLARKHGYDFICSTNFVHPQFPGVWNDIEWHREITKMIRQPILP